MSQPMSSTQKSSRTEGRSGLRESIREQLEIDILKAIVAREEYVSRLKSQCSSLKGKFNTLVSDTLDLLRIATIEVCEAIVRWREHQVFPEEFHLHDKTV